VAKGNRMKLSSAKGDYPRNACKNDTGLEHFFTETKNIFQRILFLKRPWYRFKSCPSDLAKKSIRRSPLVSKQGSPIRRSSK